MKAILTALIFLASAGAHAANYAVVPSADTDAQCRKLGFVGEFKLKASGNAWTILFASGTDRVVKKTGNGAYSSYVSCAMGCSGDSEVKLNLNKKEFSYWNSINRRPEVCKGSVVIN